MRRRPWLLFWRRRTEAMACREAVSLLSDHLDDALDAEQRDDLLDHLRTCGRCQEYLEQIRASVSLNGQISPGSLSPQERTRLADLYRAWQGEAGTRS